MINWFPGHMNKTLKQMQQDSKLCDCFVYVLDARCPNSCINPEFIKIVSKKPIVYVLNKSDLVKKQDLDKFCRKFTTDNSVCVTLCATTSGSSKVIISAIKKIFDNRLKKNQASGVNFITRAMVLGVPNSGKSTIVNNLCNKSRAVTGNRAGVTKSKQWLKVGGDIEFMDTPGVLLPNFENDEYAFNLAFVGSIKDEILPLNDVAKHLVERINKLNPDVFKSIYSVDVDKNTQELDIIEKIALKRGCLLKGGKIDFERVYKILLSDFRSGKMGKICLE